MSEVRLIDANALKYKNLAEVNGRLTYVLTAEEIDNAPSVESERPQGEWEEGNHGDYERPDFYFQCSVCKEETDDTTPYCPFCGSRMKGGAE